MSEPRARRHGPPRTVAHAAIVVALAGMMGVADLVSSAALEPLRGLSNAPALAFAYDAILDADFDQVEAKLAPACVTTPAWCRVMSAVAVWWEIALDPQNRTQDPEFLRRVELAIDDSQDWTEREPQRAEAWFAYGGAYAVRAQWRSERHERLAAARDGKRIKTALERALALDPSLHDAKFGLGMYRYYAAVAPTVLRMFRWLLLLPGGDRRGGLQQMTEARDHGVVVRGEADYQLHLIYLWYEDRAHDALALLRSLQQRYPRNPLFVLLEADVHRVYFHDASTSAVVLHALIARADEGAINQPALARRRARAALSALAPRPRD